MITYLLIHDDGVEIVDINGNTLNLSPVEDCS